MRQECERCSERVVERGVARGPTRSPPVLLGSSAPFSGSGHACFRCPVRPAAPGGSVGRVRCSCGLVPSCFTCSVPPVLLSSCPAPDHCCVSSLLSALRLSHNTPLQQRTSARSRTFVTEKKTRTRAGPRVYRVRKKINALSTEPRAPGGALGPSAPCTRPVPRTRTTWRICALDLHGRQTQDGQGALDSGCFFFPSFVFFKICVCSLCLI